MRKKTLAIVPAAGMGKRMAADKPKQYLALAGIPILIHTLKALHDSPVIDEIYLVVPPADTVYVKSLLRGAGHLGKVTSLIPGGPNRQDSTGNAVLASGVEHEILLIHDGVRPFVTHDLIERVIRGALEEGAAIAAVPIKDTVKKQGKDQFLTTVSREGLWLAQTPQAFRRDIILKAHEEARENNITATDDAALVEMMGIPVNLVLGSSCNIKITTPEDLLWGELLAKRGMVCG